MKKGFTLIELLAVIIILAVIALIVAPVVLNVVENAKEQSVVNSAYGLMDAAKYEYIESTMTSNIKISGNVNELNVAGQKPESGKWYIKTQNNDAAVKIVNAKFGVYMCNTVSKDGKIECVKNGEPVVDNNMNLNVAGLLKDESGNVLSNKSFVIYSDPYYGSTDQTGLFTVRNVEPGNHEIYIFDTETVEDIKLLSKDDVINSSSLKGTFNTSSNKIMSENNVEIGTITFIYDEEENEPVENINNSILGYISKNSFEDDSYTNITANNKTYQAHVYTFEGNQTWSGEKIFGDASDVATESTYATRMVVVKVNGDLTIETDSTVRPYYTEYGGPKGFLLYVTGTLTNNGTIDNSHGAKAEGEDVYLYQNEDGTYEVVPAEGGAGAIAGIINDRDIRRIVGENGQDGILVSYRATGGGGSGTSMRQNDGAQVPRQAGSGSDGTSYSGGSGGATIMGNYACTAEPAASNGGAGGSATCNSSYDGYIMGGGAGNPGGLGKKGSTYTSENNGANGTGGLLIIYADSIVNNNTIKANGSNGGGTNYNSYLIGGAGSGGGSVNIFYTNSITEGTVNADKGFAGKTYSSWETYSSGTGGTGTVTIGSIATGTFIKD